MRNAILQKLKRPRIAREIIVLNLTDEPDAIPVENTTGLCIPVSIVSDYHQIDWFVGIKPNKSQTFHTVILTSHATPLRTRRFNRWVSPCADNSACEYAFVWRQNCRLPSFEEQRKTPVSRRTSFHRGIQQLQVKEELKYTLQISWIISLFKLASLKAVIRSVSC